MFKLALHLISVLNFDLYNDHFGNLRALDGVILMPWVGLHFFRYPFRGGPRPIHPMT